MNRQLAFRNVLQGLTRFKGRAVLCGVGIVISVLATVFVLSMGGAVRATFQSFMSRLYPADMISLYAGASFMGSNAGGQSMRMRDIEAVTASVSQIVAWDVQNYAGFRDVRSDEGSTRTRIIGTGAQAPEVRRRGASEGEYLDQADVETRARVVVVGETVARQLFGSQSPLGATLYIENMPFQVKGVLHRVGANPHGDDEDDIVAIPYTVAMESLLKVDYVRQVAFKIGDAGQIEDVARDIVGVMRQQHGIVDGRQDDFSVVVPRQMQEMFVRNFGMFNLFLAMICVAAFLISGLVVLGVMNVSVRQRFPELGLRKAVGAESSDVRWQILWEALVIAAIGCAIGAVLAWLSVYFSAPLLARKFGIVGASMSLTAVGVGALAALATGLLGALLPARRAARLDPVEALRMR
jgi:putative ABC transport system permease protein